MEKSLAHGNNPGIDIDNLGSCNQSDCHDFSSKPKWGIYFLVIRAGILFMVASLSCAADPVREGQIAALGGETPGVPHGTPSPSRAAVRSVPWS